MEKIALAVPVIVEGRYDKAAVCSVVDAAVITTDGFAVFRNSEKRELIKRVSERGIVVLCDSDSAGGVIRSFLNGVVDKEKIYPVYAPRVPGKEKRKRYPSKEGILGVEGVGSAVLREVFEALVRQNPHLLREGGEAPPCEPVAKGDFYEDGFSGKDGAASARDRLAAYFGLPPGMTSGALLSAINVIADRPAYKKAVEEIKNG
ncbi:MAG: DUF4093 domain-containing protein [Clostridia bacterium]|nr:DUF4093 domain-containing protein [Clostridia bacterium]